HAVLVLKEAARLVDLGVDVVLAGLGADADFLELLLVLLLLAGLAGLLVLELPVVHDLAHRRPLVGGHLDEVEVGLAGHLHRLRGGDDAELRAAGADQANRADADFLVDPLLLLPFAVRVAVAGTNTWISFCTVEAQPRGTRPARTLRLVVSPPATVRNAS